MREVPSTINDCQLTFLERHPIDVQIARDQHRQYVELLTELGVDVHHLPATDELADSVFVEDTALVLDEIAIMTRPGATSRQQEVASAAAALRPYRTLEWIDAPATVDGGDIAVVGRRIYVGSTSRSNDAAIVQITQLVEPHGYTVQGVVVTGCLHLKSAVTAIGPNAVLLNPAYVDSGSFAGLEIVETDPAEPEGANAVLVGDVLVYGAEYPKTRALLESAGYTVHTVPASELAKAEGAVTCCSLLFTV